MPLTILEILGGRRGYKTRCMTSHDVWDAINDQRKSSTTWDVEVGQSLHLYLFHGTGFGGNSLLLCLCTRDENQEQ